MTKQDFELIASILHTMRPRIQPLVYRDVVIQFMGGLALSNPKFNADKFKEACYGTKKGC